MKKIIVAKRAGFCYGVKRAYDMALEFKDENPNSSVYTYGPLIHNPSVINDLNEKGIHPCEDLSSAKSELLLIRAHGVPKSLVAEAEGKGFEVLDATCPFVKRIHDIVELPPEGIDELIIIGNPKHPEIIGIAGHCTLPYKIIPDLASALEYHNPNSIASVAQTTFNTALYEEIISVIEKNVGSLLEHNTICSATSDRQNEVREIAKISDLIIVLGGKKSSNTRKLYEITKELGKDAIHIENFLEIDFEFIEKYDRIGIVAGASTPKESVDELVRYLRNQVK